LRRAGTILEHRLGRALVAAVVVTAVAAVGLTSACGRKNGRGADAPRARAVQVLAPNLPELIDPYQDSRLMSRILFSNVFEHLVEVSDSGASVPAIAESWTNPTPDVWLFRLRAGLRFHDGEPVRVEDVVTSLERSRREGSLSAGNLAEVAEIRANGPNEIRIRTRGSSVFLLQPLTAVPVAKVDARGALVGTGPYRVVEFEPGERVKLRAFEGRAGRRPFLTDVEVVRFRNAAHGVELLGRAAEVRTAEVRAAEVIVLEPPREMVAAAEKGGRLRVVSEMTSSVTYLGLGLVERPPAGKNVVRFRDLRVRQAVQLALDLPALLKGYTPVGGVPLAQMVPPGILGFNPAIPPPVRDVARARALLVEAGYPSGFAVKMDVLPTNRPLAEAIATQLREVGLEVELVEHPSREFQAAIDGKSELFLYSWVVGQEAGEALKNFFSTRDQARGRGLRNRTGYSNPEADGAIERALSALNPKERLVHLHQAVGLLAKDLPWVPLFAARFARIQSPGLVLPSRPDGMLLFADIGAAKAVR